MVSSKLNKKLDVDSYLFMSWCFAVLSCFSHANESLSPLDYNPPGFSVHEKVQARILEGVAMLCSRGSFWPRDRVHVSCVSCIAGRFFTAEVPGKLISFLVRIIFHCLDDHSSFNHSPTKEYLDCFQVLVIMNKVVKNIWVQIFVWT